MRDLQLDLGVKKIAIKDEDGDVITVLRVNIADASTANRFGGIIKRLEVMAEECRKESEEWEKQHGDAPMSANDIISLNEIRLKYINNIIGEIDGLFGAGTIANIYGADVVPDEDALSDFIGGVIPVMSDMFNQRYEMHRKKYNSNRTGAK